MDNTCRDSAEAPNDRQPPAYFLGIDGGATKTQFLLTDSRGNTVHSMRLGACNPVNVGMSATCEILDRGIRAVCRDIPPDRVAVFAGIAGGITGDNKALIGTHLHTYGFAAVGNGSDAENVVAAGLGEADGIAVILGTGIIAFAKRDGDLHRVGGYGPLFDEGGSGYHLGRDALRACLLAWEGSGRKTVLTELAEARLGCPVIDALGELYAKDRGYIASFAPTVFEACDRRDEVAREILSRNMRCAATVIDAAGRYLPPDACVRVALYGGLTARADLLLPGIRAGLTCPERYDLTVCGEAPVVGALLLAGLSETTARHAVIGNADQE